MSVVTQVVRQHDVTFGAICGMGLKISSSTSSLSIRFETQKNQFRAFKASVELFHVGKALTFPGTISKFILNRNKTPITRKLTSKALPT